MPTAVQCDVDDAPGSPLCLHLQYMEVYRHLSDTQVTAFFDAESEYINVLDLSTSFKTVEDRMRTWSAAISDVRGCLELHEPTAA